MPKNSSLVLISLFSFVALNAAACQGLPVKGSKPATEESGYISVCNILRHENSYINKKVRIKAILKTDNATYAYFKDAQANDKSCLGYNTISIASASVMHDNSVINFLNSTDEYCKDRHMVLCVVTVDMKFEAKVLENNDGPYLYLTKIFSYQYIQR